MVQLISANILETLGLGWEKMLLYFANFVILFFGMTFLLFKPIKKFMAKRQEEIKKEYEVAEEAKREAEVMKAQYEADAKEAELEAQKQIEIAKAEKEEALRANEVLLENAKIQAREIVSSAKLRAEEDRKHAIKEAREEIIDMAVSLAEDILEREVSVEDNRKLIDDCITEWSENE